MAVNVVRSVFGAPSVAVLASFFETHRYTQTTQCSGWIESSAPLNLYNFGILKFIGFLATVAILDSEIFVQESESYPVLLK
ncbi:hypothetical protein NQ317_015947 [Molorchus minor]|uniref:Uncharacterized protein n=1 Tax=Molorchus minor TaxID=1323400 RepID=A0ABQ9IQB5_9CUCU|nr:hypothetical protein NQ317_015947 [Molorchus minor]